MSKMPTLNALYRKNESFRKYVKGYAKNRINPIGINEALKHQLVINAAKYYWDLEEKGDQITLEWTLLKNNEDKRIKLSEESKNMYNANAIEALSMLQSLSQSSKRLEKVESVNVLNQEIIFSIKNIYSKIKEIASGYSTSKNMISLEDLCKNNHINYDEFINDICSILGDVKNDLEECFNKMLENNLFIKM